MMKKLGMLSAFATLFSLTPMQAQTSTCSFSDSDSGTDNSGVTATITDFSCVDTVANSFVMDVTIDASISSTFSSYCPSWYDFELKVNGTSVATDLCSGTYNLKDYVSNINNITSISIVSEDNDGWNDAITMELDVDYSYIVTTCPPPAELAVNSIEAFTAMFSWTPNGSEVLWDVELVDITAGDTATGTPTNYGVIADSLELTGLAADNMYEVYVRAYCGSGTDVESIWIGPVAFTTEPTCYPVADVNVTDIIDVSATAVWSSDETEWEIELVDVTGGGTFIGTPTVLSLTDTTYDFTGLTPENNYAFKVRSNCGPVDGNSVWSSAITFTTDPSCLAPSDIVMTSLSDSSIAISWTSNDDETSWGIELINVDNGETADLTSDYTSTDTNYVINGLDANTTYQIFVSAECSVSDHSDWTSMSEFTTLCTSASIPYIDSLNSWPTDCYSLSNSGTSSNWQVYSGGSGIIEANFWNFSSGSVTFETGKITISEQAKFEFVWSRATYSTDEEMIISYSNDGGVTWTEIWNKVSTQLASNDGASITSPGSFITTQILIPDTEVGNDLIFKFHGITDWGADFFLDEIRVLPLPDCNPAYSLALDTATATEATFSFVDIVGDNSVSWDYLITSYSDTITGNATSTPFTVTGLSSGVNYSIQVNTLCTTDSTGYSTGVSFQTECSPVSYYVQGFESYNSADLPLCWEEIEVATSTYADVEVNTFNGYNSSNGLQFYNSSSSSPSSTHLIALTPELLNVSDNWLKLRHKTNSSGAQKLVFGYMTDITDEDTFEPLDTVDLTQNTWNDYTFIPSDYPSFTEDRIAIKALFDGTYKYSYIDDILWEEIPDCYYPNAVTIDSTTLDAVYASIDPYNPTDAVWEIELVNLTTGGTFTGTPTDTVTTSIFFIDGLDFSSEYAMYIRTNCGAETSIWSSPYFFATQCAAITDFVQDFEVGTNCWTLNNIATSTSAENEIVTFTPNSGSQANYLYNSFSSDPAQTFIATVTPELANIAAGTHWIKFQARRQYSWSSSGDLELGTMSDPTDPSTYTPITTFNLNGSYQEFHHSFVSYTGTDSYIAIRLLIDGTYRRVLLDDVVWENVPECATPENVNGVDILDVTAEIDWNPISIDSAWSMELVDVTNGGSATGVATDSTTSHPYTFTGLTQNTTYAVYVQADCDTNWSVPYLFTTLISYDIEVSNFVSPISQGCMLTTAEEVVVTITNNGAQDATGFDVSYSFDGINYISDGIFSGTLASNSDTAYTLNTTFDFTVADDTNLFVAVNLPTDTIQVANDTNSIFITNLGDQLMQLEVTSGEYATEHGWFVIDTVSGTTVASHTFSSPVGGEYSNYTVYTHDVCVFVGNTYSMESWDSYGDGWNGGTYQLLQCGGVLIANNGGLSPTTPPNSFQSGGQLEAQEYFTVEECDDYDLAIVMMDSIYSSCDMTATEQGYLLVQNFGLLDITSAMNVSIEYQVNGSGWSNLATFTNFASGADSLLALPTVDMTTPLTYTFEFLVVYALDENASNDSLELDIESVDTYTEVEQDFDDAPSGWTGHIAANNTLSWEWGVPTTPVISTDVDGSAWVTRLHDNMFLNEASYLLSPCFDFSSYTEDAEVSFDFIWTSPTTSNRVNFQVSTDGGATWPPIFGGAWDNVTMPVNTTEWTHRVSLMDLAGEGDVKFRFYMDNGFSTDAEGFGMDNFEVFEHVPYTDTTLVELTVNGTPIAGFDPAVFDYTIELPYGTTVVPVVGGTVNAPFYESMVVTQAPVIPGIATVVVTAEDTNYTGTYTVNFTEAPASTNAYLSDISEDLITISGFDSLVFVYNETLSFGSGFPSVTSTTSDPTATTVQTNSGGVPGFITIVVTAQDGVTTNTYIINYDEEPADTVSTLSALTTGGSLVAGFTPSTLNYTEPTTFPTVFNYVEYTPTSTLSTVAISPAGPYSGPTLVEVTVTAQDGSSTVYTVDLVLPLSDDASLSDLTYDDGGSDVTVPGFHADSLTYTIELPFGSSVPDVGYTTTDGGATGEITNSSGVPGTTTVTVTAEDGTVTVYTIHWTEAAASDNNLLASLSFGSGTNGLLWQEGPGEPYDIQGFEPEVNEYRFYVSDLINASIMHDVNAVAQDPLATLTGNTAGEKPFVYNDFADVYKIDVTAENGDVNTYIIWPINGVGQNELEAGTVSMYPNPSTGIVNVEVKEDISNYSIEVISTTGQKVFSSEYANDNTQVVLDLSFVANGVYYIMVKDVQTGQFAREKISIIK